MIGKKTKYHVKLTEQQFKNCLYRVYLLGLNDGWRKDFNEMLLKYVRKFRVNEDPKTDNLVIE